MTEPTTARRRAALAATEELASALPALEGVCLFGSVARGDADALSDIDLLVLGADASLKPSTLRRLLPDPVQSADFSFAYHTPESLRSYLERWSRFGLHLRREGEILFDRHGRLHDILSRDVTVSTRDELLAQQRHLANYRHLDRFGGNFLGVLSHLYRIGRVVAFALLAERGILEFDSDRAFALLRDHVPDSREASEVLSHLRPFYELVTRHDTTVALPFPPYGCEDEVAAARTAIEGLLALSCHADELKD